MTDNLPTWAQEALDRAETSPKLRPYITAMGRVVIFNGAFPLKRAYAAQDHVMCACTDILCLCAALATAIEALEEILEEAQSDLDRDIIITACESALAETQSIEPNESEMPEASK